MHNVSSVQLTRDCEAVQIPVGTNVILPAGTEVDITQTLGGTYTVHALGGLYRIAAKDADALGCTAEIEHARAIVARGTSADRQVACFARLVAEGASREQALKGLVDHLIGETVGET
jgi:hypothetical protein